MGSREGGIGKGLKGNINTMRNRLNREGEFALVTSPMRLIFR